LLYLSLKSYNFREDQHPNENNPDPKDVKQEMTEPEQLENKTPASDILKNVFNQDDPALIGDKILKNLAKEFEIVQGVFFILDDSAKFTFRSSFACLFDKPPLDFSPGEGISGQAASDKKIIILSNIPDSYSLVSSGLGKGKAKFLYIIPMVFNRKTVAVIEILTFKEINENRMPALNRLMSEGGEKLGMLLYPDGK
jgi:hypothetical protein